MSPNYEYVRIGVPHTVMQFVREAKWEQRKSYGKVLRIAMIRGLIALGHVDGFDEERFEWRDVEPVVSYDESSRRLRFDGWREDRI